MDDRIIGLFDKFTHADLNRRKFLDRLALLAGGSSAAALSPLLFRDIFGAQVTSAIDDRLTISQAVWEAGDTMLAGYLARLKGGQKRPAVIVIHENRGINDHIRDVTRRMALEGFLALGVDMLSPLGGTPADQNRAREMLGSLNAEETMVRLAAAVPFLSGHSESTGKVGAIGFCWGGGYANQLAAAGTSLQASVPYYGRQLPSEQVPDITAALCLQYAALDTRINSGIADYEAALKANNKTYELYMYEEANHAFNNDSNPSRYHKEAAELAWRRTVAFLHKHLDS